MSENVVSGTLDAVFHSNLPFLPPVSLNYELCSLTDCPVLPGQFMRVISIFIPSVVSLIKEVTGNVRVRLLEYVD